MSDAAASWLGLMIGVCIAVGMVLLIHWMVTGTTPWGSLQQRRADKALVAKRQFYELEHEALSDRPVELWNHDDICQMCRVRREVRRYRR